jgi:catechol 2,3-dioxygenase-like lactoylglutathione lyase family enzyme
MTLAFKHLNILTRDLPQALRFYTEIMDFRYVMNLGPDKVVLDAGDFDFFLERADDDHLNPKLHFGLKASLDDLLGFYEKPKRNGVPRTCRSCLNVARRRSAE